MSDGLTDIARDQRRGIEHVSYLGCLLDYLKNPSEANYIKIEKASEATDDVPRGYFGGRTKLTKGLKERVEKLKQGDKREWARLLWVFIDSGKLYREFKEISPFKGKLLLKVDYGRGFVNIKSEELDEILRKRDFKTYDCDDYLIAVDVSEDSEKIDVEWARCGISGQDCPRNSEGKKRKT